MTTSNELVTAVATALAKALPVPSPLTAGVPVPAAQFAEASASLLPVAPGAALLSRVGAAPGSTASGDLALVVDSELVQALATSPMGSLDLAAAVQPAIDAASQVAAGAGAAPAQEVDAEAALSGLLTHPAAQVVALSDPRGVVVATLIIAFDAAPAPADFVQSGEPGSAPADARTLATSHDAQVRLPRQPGMPTAAARAAGGGGLDLLRDVAMEITVELGRTRMTVRELLSLTPGAVIELDRAAGSPADLLVNGTLIARGEVVVVDEDFGIRITEIVAAGADAATGHSAGAA